MCGSGVGMIVQIQDGLELLCGCYDLKGVGLVRRLRGKRMDCREGKKEGCRFEGRRCGRLVYGRFGEGGIRGCLLWGAKGRIGKGHLG